MYSTLRRIWMAIAVAWLGRWQRAMRLNRDKLFSHHVHTYCTFMSMVLQKYSKVSDAPFCCGGDFKPACRYIVRFVCFLEKEHYSVVPSCFTCSPAKFTWKLLDVYYGPLSVKVLNGILSFNTQSVIVNCFRL